MENRENLERNMESNPKTSHELSCTFGSTKYDACEDYEDFEDMISSQCNSNETDLTDCAKDTIKDKINRRDLLIKSAAMSKKDAHAGQPCSGDECKLERVTS